MANEGFTKDKLNDDVSKHSNGPKVPGPMLEILISIGLGLIGLFILLAVVRFIAHLSLHSLILFFLYVAGLICWGVGVFLNWNALTPQKTIKYSAATLITSFVCIALLLLFNLLGTLRLPALALLLLQMIAGFVWLYVGRKKRYLEETIRVNNKAQYDYQQKINAYREVVGEDPTEETEAMLFAQAIELQLLKAPASAQFCALEQMSFGILPNGAYRVSGFVDAQNSYGAMVRCNEPRCCRAELLPVSH